MICILADIIPQMSAAGFKLGEEIETVKSQIERPTYWSRSAGDALPQAISATSGWLVVSLTEITQGKQQGNIFYFGGGVVELHFNGAGVLFNISVFNGYKGALWGYIKVGDPLLTVQKRCNLIYDDGDEMHYPEENSLEKGISFIAEPESLEDAPDQKIVGISVHNWLIKK